MSRILFLTLIFRRSSIRTPKKNFIFKEIFIKNSRQRASVLVSLRQLTSEIQSRVNYCNVIKIIQFNNYELKSE
jgi:hypothetical protein